MQKEVTSAELHDEVFSAKDKVNGEALDNLLMALASNKPVDEFLSVLRKSAQAAYYELSGEQAVYEYQEAQWSPDSWQSMATLNR
jgi:hypothetical protein